jgi:anthranilate synthase component II
MKILMLDNYDSFTYNLVHYIEKITNQKIDVYRNDKISLEEVNAYDKIILSPGPGIPDEAGIMKQLIKQYGSTKSILGVCLGHQAIGEVYGGKLLNMNKVYHGVATKIHLLQKNKLFEGVPDVFEAGRYHSWIISNENVPDCLEILAEDDEKRIMALKHKEHNVYGVQFHPESVLTPDGMKMITNWINL